MSASKAKHHSSQDLKKFRPTDLMWFTSSGKILGALERKGELTIAELSENTGISKGTVRNLLRKLIKKGQVAKKRSANSKQARAYELVT